MTPALFHAGISLTLRQAASAPLKLGILPRAPGKRAILFRSIRDQISWRIFSFSLLRALTSIAWLITSSGVRVLIVRPNPVDVLILSFLGLLIVTVSVYSSLIPEWGSLVLLYSGISLVLVFLIFTANNREGWRQIVWFHDFFPVCAILVVFNSLAKITPYLHETTLDSLFIEADRLLFGTDPTVWLERALHPLLVDSLQLAYTSYYFLPVVLVLVLYQGWDRRAFDEAVFGIVLAFFLSYTGYLLFPAVGPRYALQHVQAFPLEGSPLSQAIREALDQLEKNKRDAFPSGHTAVVLVMLYYCHRHARRLLPICLPLVMALIVSTVYLRYHYVVDVLAGILLVPAAVSMTFIAMRAWWRFVAAGGSELSEARESERLVTSAASTEERHDSPRDNGNGQVVVDPGGNKLDQSTGERADRNDAQRQIVER